MRKEKGDKNDEEEDNEEDDEDEEDDDNHEEEDEHDRTLSESYSQPSTKVTAKQDSDEKILENIPLNPKIHLVHNGKWIPKEYRVGRVVKFTGIW